MSAGRETLMRRLQQIVEAWPLNPARKGRDLGEHLKAVYMERFKSLDATAAQQEVEALSRIQRNAYMTQYKRKEDTTFTGNIGESWGYSQLNTDEQTKFQQGGFFKWLSKKEGKKE